MPVLERGSKDLVYKEYGMTARGVAEDVVTIKNWLLKQPHLPIIRGDLLSLDVDKWLENYLISCKNSLERVKESLDMYFTSKILLPEVFTHRDPEHPDFVTSCKVMSMGMTPKMTPAGRRVVVFSHLRNSAEDFEPSVMMKRLAMLLDILLQEGIDFLALEVIVDATNFCFAQLTRYNLTLTKRFADLGMKALPQRIHKIHIINPNTLIDTGISFFKPFLDKKLQERIVIHRDLEDLHAALPKYALPRDFGGDAPSLAELNGAWQEKLISYKEWFRITDGVKTDESKRIGKCRYESETAAFGNPGSFRKIEVD